MSGRASLVPRREWPLIGGVLRDFGRCHLHGVPGAGKRTTLAHLATSAEASGGLVAHCVAKPLAGRRIGTMLAGDFFPDLAAKLRVALTLADDERASLHENSGSAFWRILARIAAEAGAAGCKPQLFFELNDDLLFDDNFAPDFLRGYFERGAEPPHALVMAATFSLEHLLRRRGFAISSVGGEVRLSMFEVGDLGQRTADFEALKAWLLSRPGIADEVASHVLDRVLGASGGHPALTFHMVDCFARAVADGMAARAALDAASLRVRNDTGWVMRTLTPHLRQRLERTGLAEVVRDAARIYVDKLLADPAGIEVEASEIDSILLSVGLFREHRANGRVEIRAASDVLHAALVQADLTSQLLPRLQHLAGRLRLTEEAKQREADSKLHDVHAIVRQHICETPLGKELKIELLDGLSRVVLNGRFYTLVLEFDVVAGEERVRQRDDLKVFVGLSGLGMSLWEREISLLKSLSALGHSALPQIYEGGTIGGGIQPPGGFDEIAFLRTRQQGGALDPVACARLRADPKMALREAQLLLEALVKLHEMGVSHRRILPRNILVEERGDGLLRLSLTGFEFAALIQSLVSTSASEAAAVLDRTMGVYDLAESIFFAPEVRPALSNGRFVHQVDSLGMWPQSDTFSLSMLFAHMLFAEPDPASLGELGRASENDRAAAFTAFLQRYREQVMKADGPPPGPETEEEEDELRRALAGVKALVIKGMSDRSEDRPLPDVMLEMVRAELQPYEVAATKRGPKYVVTYDRDLMARMLPANGVYRVEPNQPRTDALVRDFLSGQLLSAQRMIYAKDGAPRPRSGDRSGFQEHAKYVIVCPKALIYTSLYRRYDAQGRWREDPQILRLAYAGERQDFKAVPWQDEGGVNFPISRFDLVSTDDEKVRVGLAGRRAQSWRPILEQLTKDQRRGEAQLAFNAMSFLVDIQEHKIKIRQFPVSVLKLENQLHLRLDEAQFLKEIATKSHQSLIYAGRRDPKIFFREKIAEWLDEEADGGRSKSIMFRPVGRGKAQPLTIDRVTDGVLIARTDKNVYGAGYLTYSDSAMAFRQLEVQKKGIEGFFSSPGKFEQLNSPRPTMLVRRPVRKLWNSRSAGEPPKVRGRTPQIIENMSNADPFYALQGPPGTGKTTAVAWFIATELARDPTQRILVTSQSHAAVDTILERVRDVLTSAADGSYHLLRVMPFVADRVSAAIAERHALEPLVNKVIGEVRGNAKNSLREETDLLRREAFGTLLEATERARDEFTRRIASNASVVFSTTAASYSAQVSFKKQRTEFDIAIVDEASKAWASDLVLPLSRAARVVLVGDHKQLPPFDDDNVVRLFDRASEPRFYHAFPTIAADVEKMKAWTNPFRRLFEMRERDDTVFSFGGVSVVDFLDTQYRSIPEIGQLVSDIFYRGTVKTDPAMELGEESSITWVDTARLEEALYREERDRGWRLRNLGEAKLVRSIIERSGDLIDPVRDGIEPHEAIMVLSPYRHQVGELRNELEHIAHKLGTEHGRLDRIVRTIDAAQGSEANVVIVSLVRSMGSLAPTSQMATPEDWLAAINLRFGFLRNPERINVMLSRARKRLIVVGDFEHFAEFEVLLDGWAASHGNEDTRRAIRERHSFWPELMRHFRGSAANRIDAANLLRAGR